MRREHFNFEALLFVVLLVYLIPVIVSLVVIGVVGFTRDQLLYITFDETAAAVSGLSVSWYNRIMVMLTAIVVVGAMQIMGVILVVPVVSAAQIFRSFNASLLVSVVLSELAVILGIGVSYYAEATAGGVIVLIAVAIYVVAVAFRKPQTAVGPESTPGMGSIEVGQTETSSD